MNLYQMVVGGLEEMKSEIQSEKESRIEIEKKIRHLEVRVKCISWSVIMLCVFVCLAVVFVKQMDSSKTTDETDMVIYFTFNLDDSWTNYFLQKVKTVYVTQREQFTAWELKWNIDEILEKSPTKEILNLTIGLADFISTEKALYEVKVTILDRNGHALQIEKDFVSVPTKIEEAVDAEEKTIDSTHSDSTSVLRSINKSIDVLTLRQIYNVNESIGITLHIRKHVHLSS